MAIAYSSSGDESGYRRGRTATTRAPGSSDESAAHPAAGRAPNSTKTQTHANPVSKILPKNRRDEFVGATTPCRGDSFEESSKRGASGVSRSSLCLSPVVSGHAVRHGDRRSHAVRRTFGG